MWNLYSITTNQAATTARFRMVNRNVGNLPPMPGVLPDWAGPASRRAPLATGAAMAAVIRHRAAVVVPVLMLHTPSRSMMVIGTAREWARPIFSALSDTG
jgi:hypothetical protein